MSTEPLSEVIRIRLTSAQHRRLSDAAAIAGLSLSNYVRRRLTTADTLSEELDMLREAVQHLGKIDDARAAAVEAALLVRTLTRPEKISIAQNSMAHLGIEHLPNAL